MDIGPCPKCGETLKVVYSQFGKRYVRCAKWDPKEHPVAFPLPQSGEVVTTGELCPTCASPMITITTRKGPWTICIDPECPAKPASASGTGWKKRTTGKRPAAKRPAKRRGASAE
jgi:DNA topoisomerase-1